MTYIQWVHAKVHGSGPGAVCAADRVGASLSDAASALYRRGSAGRAATESDRSTHVVSDANCDDPVHGSSPCEIVFRHVPSWISLPFARRWKNNSSKSSSTGDDIPLLVRLDLIGLLPVGGGTTPSNQGRLASSTGVTSVC